MTYLFINYFPEPKQKLIVPVTIDKTFTQGLKDTTSDEFKSLARNIETDLRRLLCDRKKFSDCAVKVIKFTPGSVTADAQVTATGKDYFHSLDA